MIFLLGSVVRMVFATGECCHSDVCSWVVLSEWCLLPVSVVTMMFSTGECYQNGVCYRGVLSQ